MHSRRWRKESMKRFRRSVSFVALALVGALALPLSWSGAAQGAPAARVNADGARGATGLKGADPSVLRVGDTYIAVKSADGGILVRQASSLDGLASAPGKKV